MCSFISTLDQSIIMSEVVPVKIKWGEELVEHDNSGLESRTFVPGLADAEVRLNVSRVE